MGYSAQAVANCFLDLANKENKEITPLKIQKLVYIAHGWFLAVTDKPLVDDEFVEAWQYGPVFPHCTTSLQNLADSRSIEKPLNIVSTL